MVRSRSHSGGALSLLICIPLALPGCGSFFFRTQQKLRAECTNVPTATFVARDGSGSGEGSGVSGEVLELDRRKDYDVEVKANGYASQIIHLTSESSVWRITLSIVMNAAWVATIVGIPVPFLGIPIDISAGAWRVLEPTGLRVELVPDGSAPTSPTAQPTAASWPTTTPTSSTAFCTSCGTRAGSTAFCTSCGTRLR